MDSGFERVTIVGVGLIGGSLGLALRDRGLALQVTGVGHRRASLDRALERRAVDRATLSVSEGVAGADLVVLATPVRTMVPIAEAAREALGPDAIVIDVGSTKARLVAEVERVLEGADARFVGCHPLAGSERRSVEAADATLFEGAVTVVTPTGRTDTAALARAEALWQSVGSRVVRLSPADHDAYLARTSHLPHAVAAMLALTVAEAGDDPAALSDFIAGGFRDTTRVASGDPTLWRDILLENREEVLTALGGFRERLTALGEALQRDDDDAVHDLLARAKETRDALAERAVARG